MTWWPAQDGTGRWDPSPSPQHPQRTNTSPAYSELLIFPFASQLPPEGPGGSVTTGKFLPQSGPHFPPLWSEVQTGDPPKHKHSSLLRAHLQLPDSQSPCPENPANASEPSSPLPHCWGEGHDERSAQPPEADARVAVDVGLLVRGEAAVSALSPCLPTALPR